MAQNVKRKQPDPISDVPLDLRERCQELQIEKDLMKSELFRANCKIEEQMNEITEMTEKLEISKDIGIDCFNSNPVDSCTSIYDQEKLCETNAIISAMKDDLLSKTREIERKETLNIELYDATMVLEAKIEL